MENKTLEARIKSLEDQLKEITQMKTQVQHLQDVEDIKRLQCAYGYYLEHWMGQEIIDLFSKRPDASATLVEGTYIGQEGIKRYFGKSRTMPPEFLHQVMQVSPVITVEPDGQTAKGRWFGYGSISVVTPKGVKPVYISVIYEMDYIKEDNIWKIWKLALQMHYSCPAGKSWVSPDRLAPDDATVENVKLSPDKWAEFEIGYPSGYIYPFHFNHPVTGKHTSEAESNATLKLKPNIYRS